mmetsp:Transcript_4371/g.10580  ORF Transcript_4371/g.10580 Transcript_4371/m.10580 type:complete len:227 (+) Transcript_4371:135-815(+)
MPSRTRLRGCSMAGAIRAHYVAAPDGSAILPRGRFATGSARYGIVEGQEADPGGQGQVRQSLGARASRPPNEAGDRQVCRERQAGDQANRQGLGTPDGPQRGGILIRLPPLALRQSLRPERRHQIHRLDASLEPAKGLQVAPDQEEVSADARADLELENLAAEHARLPFRLRRRPDEDREPGPALHASALHGRRAQGKGPRVGPESRRLVPFDAAERQALRGTYVC